MVTAVIRDLGSAGDEEDSALFSGGSSCLCAVAGELLISEQKFSEEVGVGASVDSCALAVLVAGVDG